MWGESSRSSSWLGVVRGAAPLLHTSTLSKSARFSTSLSQVQTIQPTLGRESLMIKRRAFLAVIPMVGIGLATGKLLASGSQQEDEVTPAEDLMREHGVLKRVLLVYDEVRHRIASKEAFPA